MHRFGSLLLLILFALSAAGAAAGAAAGQTTLVVQAGVASAKLEAADGGEYSDDYSDGSRRGVSLGAAVTLPVAPNLALHLGGAYVQKGASIGILADDIVDAFFVDLKLDYIELSALARASIPAGVASFHLLAGPTVAFEATCTTELTYSLGGDTVESDFGRDYSETSCTERHYGLGAADRKAVEFGVVGGVGADFPVGVSTRVSLDLLYTLGLSAVLDDTKNRTITLRAGISVPIG